ncbi:rhodanese-like domain-containing protein [Histidinibacterium aquaticum]|uniref:Rhodanese-like domain-containing protein n=1 Tax=Histidinibacterium aquaticum TaxID=2613962 RepID=A0A5J5GGA0_9RHOB|nr:rhodanese-like domain-containing protein [Histidinibacterium aquaticum]KAA9007117.1 rhodanese-like domain-containing protein [Histidinibacterium aquaticum]
MKIEETEGGTLETWDADEVEAGLEAGEIVLIDVRTPQEYMVEHVHGALLMPMAFFRPETLPGETEKKLVFHCGSGVRSEKVARRVLENGRPVVRHLGGGFAAWKQAKKAYVGTDMASGAPKKMG